MYMFAEYNRKCKLSDPTLLPITIKKIKDLKNQQKITTNEKLLKRYHDLGVHMDKYYFS